MRRFRAAQTVTIIITCVLQANFESQAWAFQVAPPVIPLNPSPQAESSIIIEDGGDQPFALAPLTPAETGSPKFPATMPPATTIPGSASAQSAKPFPSLTPPPTPAPPPEPASPLPQTPASAQAQTSNQASAQASAPTRTSTSSGPVSLYAPKSSQVGDPAPSPQASTGKSTATSPLGPNSRSYFRDVSISPQLQPQSRGPAVTAPAVLSPRATAMDRRCPTPAASALNAAAQGLSPGIDGDEANPADCPCACAYPFMSDPDFYGFIGPITSPFLAKDPRSLTEARFVFLNNWGRGGTPLIGNGDFQIYAMQLRLALNDRFNIFLDRNGFAAFHPAQGNERSGSLDINGGFKYVLLRDPESQFLLTAGAQYQAPTGSASIFQNQGDGLFDVFAIAGQQFGVEEEEGPIHLLASIGQTFAASSVNSQYFHAHLHVDRQFGPIYPLVELNWLHFNGNGSLSQAAYEGDGLFNLGSGRVSGNNWASFAFGAKMRLGDSAEVGAAYEFPISNADDLLSGRLTAELIFRY